jgi:hypothetical protein
MELLTNHIYFFIKDNTVKLVIHYKLTKHFYHFIKRNSIELPPVTWLLPSDNYV